jgi:hypothetical protein
MGGQEKAALYVAGRVGPKNAGWNLDSGLEIKQDPLGIPVKANMIPEGRRTPFRSEGEQQSERSDAGMVIVE